MPVSSYTVASDIERKHNIWNDSTHTKEANEPRPGGDLRIHFEKDGKR